MGCKIRIPKSGGIPGGGHLGLSRGGAHELGKKSPPPDSFTVWENKKNKDPRDPLMEKGCGQGVDRAERSGPINNASPKKKQKKKQKKKKKKIKVNGKGIEKKGNINNPERQLAKRGKRKKKRGNRGGSWKKRKKHHLTSYAPAGGGISSLG